MKVWGLMLCFVLVATVACVVAAPEGVLPEEENVPTDEYIDVMTRQRCTQPSCRNICRVLGYNRGVCTSWNRCTCGP